MAVTGDWSAVMNAEILFPYDTEGSTRFGGCN
jgi:hypothetical protein